MTVGRRHNMVEVLSERRRDGRRDVLEEEGVEGREEEQQEELMDVDVSTK